jgi:hypothetical protein
MFPCQFLQLSVAEPHHFYASPAAGKMFDAPSDPALKTNIKQQPNIIGEA